MDKDERKLKGKICGCSDRRYNGFSSSGDGYPEREKNGENQSAVANPRNVGKDRKKRKVGL